MFNRNTSQVSRVSVAVITLCALAGAAGCSGKRARPVTVGCTPSTEFMVLTEIVAQASEKRLGKPVIRRWDMGDTAMAYQALLMGELDVYPEETNAIVSSVLKEALDSNPDVMEQRVRGEVARLGTLEVLGPLGIHRRRAMVVRARDARSGDIDTLEDVARLHPSWRLGDTRDFAERTDGRSALLTTYNLQLRAVPKTLAAGLLYPALAANQVDLIAGYDTDGPLAGSEYRALGDSRNAFRESRTCLLVRREALARYAGLRDALAQLSGKLSNARIQQLNFEVDVKKQPVKNAAAGFLRQAGL